MKLIVLFIVIAMLAAASVAIYLVYQDGDQPPATDAQQVISYFSDKIDIVLDGGPSGAGNHSTIVKVQNDTFNIIRHGVIEEERINRCLNESCISIRS